MCWIQNTAKNIVIHSCVCALPVDTRRRDSREAAKPHLYLRASSNCVGTRGVQWTTEICQLQVFTQTNTNKVLVQSLSITLRHIRINYSPMVKITPKSQVQLPIHPTLCCTNICLCTCSGCWFSAWPRSCSRRRFCLLSRPNVVSFCCRCIVYHKVVTLHYINFPTVPNIWFNNWRTIFRCLCVCMRW